MTKIKSKILVIILALFMAVFGGYVGATAPANANAESSSYGIITVTPGAKAENGKLSFHYWINKRLLNQYSAIVPLTHTYLNVLINGEEQSNLAYCVEGFNYVEWEYNLSNDVNSGYGQFVVTVDVSQYLTDTIQVVFGFTDTGENHVDLFSDAVTYTGVFYDNNELESLRLQINFLKSELARLNAENVTNYDAYVSASAELERLQAEYDVLKEEYDEEVNADKIRGWGLLISVIIGSAIIILLALLTVLKTLKSKINLYVKIAIILVTLAVVGIAGYLDIGIFFPLISLAI